MSFFRARMVKLQKYNSHSLLLEPWANCRHVPNVCFQHSCSAGSHVIQSKCIWRWYNVVLARPTCCWQSSGVYIYAFICVQYFKHTQLPLAITLHTKICVALVQRPLRASNKCWRMKDAPAKKKSIFNAWVMRRLTYVWLSLTVRKKLKNAGTERAYNAHSTCS